MTKAVDRRKFIQRMLLGGGFLAGSSGLAAVGSEDRVDPESAQAHALGYQHDAEEVDLERFPKRSGEQGGSQYCFNCALYQGGMDDEWASCAIFKGQVVAGRGWCNAWVVKQ
jgi:hypothetical protein